MRRGRVGVAFIALAGCSQPATHDASADGSMPDVVDVAVSSDARPWALEGTVVDEFDAPLEGAAVRAERGDTFVETVTDADGRFRLAVDDDGGWDVTAAADGRAVMSWIGVDGPFAQPIRLPAAVAPRRIPFSGTSPTLPAGHMGYIGVLGGGIESINQDDWTGHYDVLPNVMPPYPELRVFMLDVDPLRHMVNAGVSAPFPRDGRPIANVAFALPAVPPPIRQTNVTVHLPNAGLLSSESVITEFRASPLQIGVTWNAEVGRGLVDGPYDGVARLHFEYVDGPLAPDHLTLNATFVRTHSVLVGIARRTFTEGEVITLPVVRVMEVDGSTLGDATFSADATPGGVIAIRLIDPTRGVVWFVRAYHPERPFFHRLPVLPTSVALSSLTSTDRLTALILSGRDPDLPDRLEITTFGSVVGSIAALGVEGR